MKTMVNEEIKAIADKLKTTLNPTQIFLFGSYAKDNYSAESDYDFYVVVNDNAGDKIALEQKAYKSLRGIRKRPVDIVVGYDSSFKSRVQLPTLEKTVAREGILL